MGKEHRIIEVKPNSIAEELGIEKGDILLKINQKILEDSLDYGYLIQEEVLEVLLKKKDGQEWILEIEKEEEEDLGLVFDHDLMDEYHSCSNHCMFCFIDQMPSGMRETLYFKDDDARLSFLHGNYITLTNLREVDVERILRYRLSPINISVHTTNPVLRNRMLANRLGGESLKILKRFADANLAMNGQIVLCKGINDGKELERTIADLSEYIPAMQSLSVVPVGLTNFRDKLYPLESFEREDAIQVLELIEKWQTVLWKIHGVHFVHASDEFYLLAGKNLPKAESYDGYLQWENGVGMLRSFMEEAKDTLNQIKVLPKEQRRISLATGILAAPYLREVLDEICKKFPQIHAMLYPIRNEFFGEKITVAGLLTGGDIQNQLKGKDLGTALLLPEHMLKSTEDIFLDDIHLKELEQNLAVPIQKVETDGKSFVQAVCGLEKRTRNKAIQQYER
ncbi:radical SAM protein [Clostridia bacterium]|nr:radical SAM protein [Clostridia bacterium]